MMDELEFGAKWRKMRQQVAIASRLAAFVICCTCTCLAVADTIVELPQTPIGQMSFFDPPQVEGPINVQAAFQLHSIMEINDQEEKVEFSGVLTLIWKDPRNAFDPVKEGVREKVYSGEYQFNEVAPCWYPQVVLANSAGEYESRAVILRIQPDGTSTFSESIEAIARVDLNMRRFPFDRHRLRLIFRVFEYDADEVALKATRTTASRAGGLDKVAQWRLGSAKAATRINSSGLKPVSELVVRLDAAREPLFMLRLVVIPLTMIVILSWSVFWMDRSSLGDRMSVSFVGILTAVAYQITLEGIVPNVSYVTLMNGFLNLSFLFMCGTVGVNLYVGAADRRGHERGDHIDRVCRWIFPIAYFGINIIFLTLAFLLF